jgi:hypothetical protein
MSTVERNEFMKSFKKGLLETEGFKETLKQMDLTKEVLANKTIDIVEAWKLTDEKLFAMMDDMDKFEKRMAKSWDSLATLFSSSAVSVKNESDFAKIIEMLNIDKLEIEGFEFKDNKPNRKKIQGLVSKVKELGEEGKIKIKLKKKDDDKIKISFKDKKTSKDDDDDDKEIMESVDKFLEDSIESAEVSKNKGFIMSDNSSWNPRTGELQVFYNNVDFEMRKGYTEKDILKLVGDKQLDEVLKFYNKNQGGDYDYMVVNMRHKINKIDPITKDKEKGRMFKDESNYEKVTCHFIQLLEGAMRFHLESVYEIETFRDYRKKVNAANQFDELFSA